MNTLFEDLFEKINHVKQKYNEKTNNKVIYEISYLYDFMINARYKDLLQRTQTLINKISHSVSNGEQFQEEVENQFNDLLIHHDPPLMDRKQQINILNKIHANLLFLNSIDELNKFIPQLNLYDDKLCNQLIQIFKQSLLKTNLQLNVEEYLKPFEFDFKKLFVDLVGFFISKNVTIPQVDFYPKSKENVDKKFDEKFYEASNSEINSDEIEQLLTFGLHNKDLDRVLVKAEVVLKD